MKIGIMTFHKSINYGSVLQAYALAYKLRELGHKPEIIDYEQKNYDFQYKIIKPPFSLEAIKHDFVNLSLYGIMKERKAAFERFRRKRLPLSDREYRFGDDLSVLDGKYDLLICGSDQIWNTNASDFDTAYFFPFIAKTPRISYAVSLNKGELSNAANPKLLKKNILDFRALSARETSGQEKIYNFIGGKKEVSVCLDPTLLNGKEAYEKISSKRIIREPYIFFYSVNFAPEAVKAAKIVSERLGLPVYTLAAGKGTRSLYNVRKDGKIKILRKHIGPENFLGLIRFADKVVTNSFHGTAFSIIFEKDFFSVKSVDKNGKPENDTRLYNILSFLGLQDRYLSQKELLSANLSEKTDYSAVRSKREEQIRDSAEYLRRNIF